MTDRYAVIGNPISHSKSPLIHRMFAEQTGQDISYEAIEAPFDGFATTVFRLRDAGYLGCNVTVPFKFEAFELCDEVSSHARNARAVNTLLFRDGKILGTNTDGAGLITDIEQNLEFRLMWKDALLLGAGGAAAGVLWPLFNAGSGVTIANRTLERAQKLAEDFEDCSVFARSFDQLAERRFDLVINATSSGLRDEKLPLPEDLFKPGALAYDMMYGRETPFMAFAREHGAQVADGLGMLVEQAAEAFRIWRGDVRLDTRAVIDKLRA